MQESFTRLVLIETLARESLKAKGITMALDQALTHGQAEVREYGGAFEALHDIASTLEQELTELANEINEEKWG